MDVGAAAAQRGRRPGARRAAGRGGGRCGAHELIPAFGAPFSRPMLAAAPRGCERTHASLRRRRRRCELVATDVAARRRWTRRSFFLPSKDGAHNQQYGVGGTRHRRRRAPGRAREKTPRSGTFDPRPSATCCRHTQSPLARAGGRTPGRAHHLRKGCRSAGPDSCARVRGTRRTPRIAWRGPYQLRANGAPPLRDDFPRAAVDQWSCGRLRRRRPARRYQCRYGRRYPCRNISRRG